MDKRCLLALAMLALAVRFPLAQVTSGTISGIVRDTSGAVIPGVAIGLRNLETGTTREIMTNDQGRYTAANLPLGNYEIRAQKEGFEVQIRRGVVLTVGREAVVNFELPVGAVTQMVEVTGEAPLIETTTSSISAMVEKVQIQDLPLNGRSFDNLAVLQPGVALSRFQSRAFQNSYTTKISIRGARSEQNSFLLDGTDVMGPTNNIPGGVGGESLGVDTVREFRVETTTFSAQYGRAAGGVINVITTSGTNEFRGTVFEFLRNDNLDARNFFDRDPRNPLQRSDPPEFKRNQFGFSAGGPIRADKLFFFGSYEGLRERLGQTITSRVPTAEARQGRLPTQTVSVNADIVPYLNLYPLPNSQDRGDGTADFIRRYSQPTDHDFWTARLDYNMSSSDSMFARYTFDDSSRLRDAGFDFLIENQGSRNQFLTVEHSHIFSPALLNTFRFGFNRSFSDLQPETPGLDDSTLNRLAFIPGRPLFKSGNGVEPGGGVTGLVINPNAPRIFAWNLFEWSDDIAYTRGTHTLKGGFLIKKLQFNQIEALNSGGVYTFGSLADFLQGARANVRVLQGPGLALGWRYAYYGWYVQDDIRIGSQLTLNLGFRHEFYTKPTEKYNRVCNLDYLLQDFRCGGSLWPSYYSGVKNFGPRFGFAWDLFGEGKTSVRGGFGIFYDAMSPIWWVAPADTQPPSATRLSADNVPFPNLGAQLAAGVGQIQLSPSPAGFTGTPSTMQWSLTVQRQLPSDVVLSLGYAGSVGRHLWTRAQKNIKEPVIQADGRKFFPASGLRRRPDLSGSVRYNNTEANSNYNGFLLGVQKRMSHGMQFQAAYTFSKAHDTSPNISSSQTRNGRGTAGTLDPDDWKVDRSLSDFDMRQNFSFNSTWELPFGPGKQWGSGLRGVAAKLVEGWQLSAIFRAASSSPMTISAPGRNWSRNGSTTDSSADRPDLVLGASNSPINGTSAGCTVSVISSTGAVTGTQTIPGGFRLGTPDRWYDPCAFRVPELGYYGNLGRNTVAGPNQVTVDFSIIRNIGLPLSEQSRLQFRTEFFNILNRANFDVPNLNAFDSQGRIVGSAGTITETSTSSRQVQFGLKLFW